MVIVKPGRDREADDAHLGEVGPLAAEQVLHVGLALGLPAAERIDVLMRVGHRSYQLLDSCGTSPRHSSPPRPGPRRDPMNNPNVMLGSRLMSRSPIVSSHAPGAGVESAPTPSGDRGGSRRHDRGGPCPRRLDTCPRTGGSEVGENGGPNASEGDGREDSAHVVKVAIFCRKAPWQTGRARPRPSGRPAPRQNPLAHSRWRNACG